MNDLTDNRIHNFRSLYQFCVEAITTCLSFNADKACVPFALFALSALLLFTSCVVGFLPQVNPSAMHREAGEHWSRGHHLLLPRQPVQHYRRGSFSTAGYPVFGVLTVAVDFVNIVSIFLTVYICWNSTKDRRLRIIRRRRRQQLLCMCLLMGLGGYATSETIPAYRPFARRKLLDTFLQDNTQVLGYTLGMISLAIVCTSRFPAINRACRREKVSPAAGVSAVLCSSTGLLYISALLLSDPVVPGLFLKAAPWLLSALCGATLDLLVLVIFWCRKGARRKPERISLDTQSLLEFPHFHKRHGNQLKKHRKQEKNNSKTPKTAEIGHYMDVSVQPAVKECREDLMLFGRDNLATGTTRGVQLVQVASGGSVCSSCTSYDSSSYSSDLEWDFEEARSCWSEPPWRTEEGDEFLQDWPKNPPPFVASTCSASDFTEMPL
ncbi:transmembrane protein 44 isoform X3 [Gadus chalcogrammus]|uniref:transmembrane protein 44 isoform X3 n=1 Tax=Gadus chalcogrammus TaxID=1042646 RepID=UPI0024C4D6AD|nr:transmembrane protein 44 isoform X3 [Gadus chalcogrammus]